MRHADDRPDTLPDNVPDGVSRRRFVRWMTGAGAFACGAASVAGSAAASAQSRRILGLNLPDTLVRLLPADAVNIADSLQIIARLEREADALRLPLSPLWPSRAMGVGAVPTDISALYAVGMPRLVALIDRGERRAPALAERAGALLARLHHAERTPASAWLVQGTDQTALSLDTLDYTLDDALGATEGIAGAENGTVADAPYSFPEPPAGGAAAPPIALPPVETPAPTVPQGTAVAAPTALLRSTRFGELAEEYAALFATATLRSERSEAVEFHLQMLRRYRERYQAVSTRTGVPWFVIGTTHGLEASYNFRAHLHNGDYPLNARTRQVPANRPSVWAPPSDWDSSAIDALRHTGLAGQSDWSLPRILHRLEAYNGFGYRSRRVASPYLWSFSNHYERGKFVADGRWSASARSQQCGAGLLIKLLADAGDIRF